jgi:hypothetical protein
MTCDNEVLLQVRESFSEVHMHTPVETILARGHSRRNRRRMIGLTTTGVAAAAALALGLSGIASLGHTPAGPNTAQLTAFTVTNAPDGQSILTLRKGAQYRLDPIALRHALAAHGIPAVVNVGTMCDTDPEPSSGLDQVISTNRQADGSVVTTFDPAALPSGTEISIGYFSTYTTFGLIETGAPLHCGPRSSSNGTTPGQVSKPVTGESTNP